ncbi:nuclear GTPase SLIP-GC-like isoform 1-T2 [Polymixia lowei]
MSMQGKKRAGDDASTSRGLQEHKRHCATTNYSTTKEALTDAKKFIEQIFHYIEEMPCSCPANTDLIKDLKEKRRKMEERFKEKCTVGVLGVTGAGKSSLVNAVLGEKKLLPSGSIDACTSVVIRVEANMTNSSYEAEIEFISKEEWEKELKSLVEIIRNAGDEDQQILKMATSKIKALYGDDAVKQGFDHLIGLRSFNEIFATGKKNLSYDSVREFSKMVEPYIRSKSKGEGTQYWPLVKCVTIKVPNPQGILENIVLVDVPGTGDWNKARDKMWETEISNCSSVWVVADIVRAASETAAWSILDRSMNNLGPGGQCGSISFICTKTDNIPSHEFEDDEDEDGNDLCVQAEDKRKRACILDRNKQAKEVIEKDVHGQYKQFGEFEVFTVSSDEFTRKKPILSREETEIPKLRALLKKLNIQQSKKLEFRYFLESYAIISRIHVTNSETTEKKIQEKLSMSMKNELQNMRQFISGIQDTFRRHLTTAAFDSTQSCVQTATDVIKPEGKWRGYHRTLKALCESQGSFRSKNGKVTDMNATLATTMYHAIEETFEEVFPNTENGKSIFWMIESFNIISHSLEKCLPPQHLEYIKIEQIKLKTKLKEDIVREKKKIFRTIKDSIQTSMLPAYEKAAEMKGTGSMKKMQDILEQHIETEKETMFLVARKSMLDHLEKLGNDIINELATELQKAITQPLDASSSELPDVSEYYHKMKNHFHRSTSTSTMIR